MAGDGKDQRAASSREVARVYSGMSRRTRSARSKPPKQGRATLYLLAAPALIWFIIFVYYPTALGFLVSFQKYRIVGNSEWVGLANYVRVFSTLGLLRVVENTLVIGLSALALNIVFPILVALLLNEVFRSLLKKFFQTSIYIAHLFSWVVIAGIWIYMLAPDRGILNILLGKLGIPPVYFMSRAQYGRPLVVFLILWKDVGYLCILYLASISTINPELYESAVIDGAGRFSQAVFITLPSLVPTIKVLALLGITDIFTLFDPIWVLRNGGNSPAIDTLMIYLKQYGIDRFEMGYTSAISTLIFSVILAITLLTKQGLRYKI